MQVIRCPDAQSFLDATHEMRAREPLRTNVMGSVATSVASGARTYDQYFWWTLRDDDQVVGFAMRTAPHGLILSPMAENAAVTLADVVAAVDPDAGSVNGPVAPVRAFARAYGERRSLDVSEGRHEVLQAIDALVEPSVPGEFAWATPDDEDVVLAWSQMFHEELALDEPNSTASMRERLTSGGVGLWRVDGQPVSLAAHSAPVESPGAVVVRVGPVFTPLEQRGHGYAAAVTAGVTRPHLEGGRRVMLYTDAANPTSNGVYRRLGYYEVDRFVRREFVAGPGGAT